MRSGDSDLIPKVSAEADDSARTVKFLGAKDDVKVAMTVMAVLDVDRPRLRATVHIVSPVDAVDTEIVAGIKSNIPLEINETESRVKMSLVARMIEDGSFTVFIGNLGAGAQKGVVKKVAPNEAFRFAFVREGIRLLAEGENPDGDVAKVSVSVASVQPPVPTDS
ncbi:hypothetical protein BH11ARM2_BH11ARM2_08420 [soil metagenome]